MLNGREWLDENPEMMKQIPLEGERVGSIVALRIGNTTFRNSLVLVASLSAILLFGGRGGIPPIINLGTPGKIGGVVFFFMSFIWVYFLGRHEKGHVDIYPEMIVFYDYDPDRKEPRPSHFYYWKDIVQYHAGEGYIWLGDKDSVPVRIWGNMAKLRPYFEEYAPHAEIVRFSMDRYFKKRAKQADKARKAARKAEKNQENNNNKE